MSTQTETLIKNFGGEAVKGALISKNLFPSVMMAQYILESGWDGNAPGNSLFGIKADTSWSGKVISNSTHENVGGANKFYQGSGKIYNTRLAAVQAGENPVTLFRAYATPGDAFYDRNKFLQENPRYTTSGVFTATTPEQQAQALQAGGYATAPNYADSLISIINNNGLKNLDKKKTLCEQVLSL